MSTATLVSSVPTTAATAASDRNDTQQILDFVTALSATMGSAVKEIKEVNSRTLLLSLNAKIEAHRAGPAGAAFGVVANEMQQLADKTNRAADAMEHRAADTINELKEQIRTSIRGGRLSDLALMNIDLVDRNLYERTCDVRWWATDSSLVDALQSRSDADVAHASHRLGVILSAYTVYCDLVLCDLNGKIIANGRPETYPSVGSDVKGSAWFRSAAHSASGEVFGFESAHASKLVKNQSVLIYSCGVREEGSSNGRLLGVLGILFDWETFAQTIVNQTPISSSERATTRCVICDDRGFVMADSHGKQLNETISVGPLQELMNRDKGFITTNLQGRTQCIAHAKSPGFETYKTGWHSLIFQDS